MNLLVYEVPKWTKSQMQHEDKKIYVLSLNFELHTCSLSLSCVSQFELCAHVLSVWVVCINWENMFTLREYDAQNSNCVQTERTCAHNSNWENMCTQLKLREHVHTTQTERTSKLTYIFCLYTVFGFLSTLAPHTGECRACIPVGLTKTYDGLLTAFEK